MSECELPRYYVCKEISAKREHKCCECVAPIHRGERHLRISACWEKPQVFRQHLLCQQACELVRDSGINDDECLAFGELDEFWRSDNHWYPERDMPTRRLLWRLMLRIYRRERYDKPAVAA